MGKITVVLKLLSMLSRYDHNSVTDSFTQGKLKFDI